jgi:hypothetical protein
MERIIRKCLLAWLLLLGAQLLTQVLPLPGGAQLGYGLVWMVILTSPLVALLIVWLLGLMIRETLHRLRVLRRATKWKRNLPLLYWNGEDWVEKPNNRDAS